MSTFAVDLESLGEFVERIVACSSRLAQVEEDVDARMTRLHASWLGDAAARHAEAHRRWAAGARQVHEALEVLRSVASTADGNYSAAVQANVGMWRM